MKNHSHDHAKVVDRVLIVLILVNIGIPHPEPQALQEFPRRPPLDVRVEFILVRNRLPGDGLSCPTRGQKRAYAVTPSSPQTREVVKRLGYKRSLLPG